MNTRRIAVSLVAALLLPCSLHAAAPPATGALSSAEKARSVLLAKGAERTAARVFDAVIASLQESEKPEDVEIWTKARKRMVPRDLIDRLVPLYQRHLSNEDLDAMLRFYQSPAGKRLSEQEPAIAEEMLQVSQQWGERIRKQVLADLKAKGKQDIPAPAAAAGSGNSAGDTNRIRRLLQAMGGGQQGEQIVDSVLEVLRQSRPDVDPNFWPALRARIRTEELLELSVPIYQRHVPEADIDDLTRFYLSPAGRHLIEKQPAIVAESIEISREWATDLLEPIFQEILAKSRQREEHSAEPGGELRVAAERGDAKAQLSLAEAFERGKHGVAKNLPEAVTWYKKAAGQGSAEAQNRLGELYLIGGPGITPDKSLSVTWFRKAAEQGHRRAIQQLGFAYLIGEGVPEDPAEAAKWLRKAAQAGDTPSMVFLAELQESGRGVPRDVAEAERWYRSAAERKDRLAEYRLGMMLLQRADVPAQTEGQKWLQASADHGSDEAKKALNDLKAAKADPPVDEVLLKTIPGTGEFTGEPIELHLRDAGMRGVLGLLAQLTGLNLVVDARVNARITGDFTGPWDEVLEKLLNKSGLKHRVHGTTIGIGPEDSPLIKSVAPEDGAAGADPVSLTLTAAQLQDVIRVFEQMGVKFDRPEVALPGSVTAFVIDTPLKSLVRLILQSTGYSCEEQGGVFKVRPLPELSRYAAAAKATVDRCQTAACDDFRSLKLRATLTPQGKGAPTVSLFEFTEDRNRVMRTGDQFDEKARVVEASPRKVVVAEKRDGTDVPVTFRIETMP